MDPTFSAPASLGSVTLELQAQVAAAVAVLPDAHRQAPFKGKIV